MIFFLAHFAVVSRAGTYQSSSPPPPSSSSSCSSCSCSSSSSRSSCSSCSSRSSSWSLELLLLLLLELLLLWLWWLMLWWLRLWLLWLCSWWWWTTTVSGLEQQQPMALNLQPSLDTFRHGWMFFFSIQLPPTAVQYAITLGCEFRDCCAWKEEEEEGSIPRECLPPSLLLPLHARPHAPYFSPQKGWEWKNSFSLGAATAAAAVLPPPGGPKTCTVGMWRCE